MPGHTDIHQLLIFWGNLVSYSLLVNLCNIVPVGNADVLISRMSHKLFLIFLPDIISLDPLLAKWDPAGATSLAFFGELYFKIYYFFSLFCCPVGSFSVKTLYTQAFALPSLPKDTLQVESEKLLSSHTCFNCSHPKLGRKSFPS